MMAAARTVDLEEVAVILTPHFDAVRDQFAAHRPPRHGPMRLAARTQLLVDPAVHDSPRHYAQCRDDGLQIRMAPEAADLLWERIIAILAHEFGHALDFLYPAHWQLTSRFEAADYAPPTDRRAARAVRRWAERTDDQVEWTADAIAYAVTGMRVGYCGSCMVQCFGGPTRPRGLR